MKALQEGADQAKAKYQTGVVLTEGCFYDGPAGNRNAFWKKCGVLGVEMEASVLLTICGLRGVQAGCILNVDNYVFERY